jgi:ATP-dependent RNA helicase MSS116
MPLKPLTVDELSSQVNDLVTKYDENPTAFAKDWEPSSRNEGKNLFQGPLIPRIEGMTESISSFLGRIDEEAVTETFTSLLGYYIPKSMELRAHKQAIVQGCKDWATEACGLPVPPYVSESFLQRLGVDERRQKTFGRGGYSSSGRRQEYGMKSWEGRGQQRSWGREPSSSSRRSFADELGVKDFNRPYDKDRLDGGSDSWGSSRRSNFGRRDEGRFGDDGEGQYGRRQSGQGYGQRESGGGFGMRGNGGSGRRDGGFGGRQSGRRDEWSGRK